MKLKIISNHQMAKTTFPQPTILKQDVLTAAKGGTIIFAGSLFGYVMRFILGILLARYLGAEQFGLYDLTLTAISVTASLATLGMGPTLVRYVSIFLSKKDSNSLWGTLQIGLGLPLLLSLFIGITIFALATPISKEIFDEQRLVPLLKIASLAIPFTTLNELMAFATRGFKKMQYSVIAQEISHSVIKLILILLLAIIGLKTTMAVGAHVITLAIVTIMLLYFLNKLFSLMRPSRTGKRKTKELLNYALPVYLSSLIDLFRGNLEPILLGAMHSFTQVGVFSVANRVTTIGTMINDSLFFSSMPIVSELHDQGKMEQLGDFYQTTTRWTFTFNLPLFLTIVLFPYSILSVFGQSFTGGATALIILATASLVRAAAGTNGVLLDMTGNTRLKVANTIAATAFLFIFSFLLIPRWGMIGAALVALGQAIFISVVRLFEIFILYRLIPYTISFFKPIAAGFLALAVGITINQLIPSETQIIYMILNSSIVLAVYASMILLQGLSQGDRAVLNGISQRLRSILKK